MRQFWSRDDEGASNKSTSTKSDSSSDEDEELAEIIDSTAQLLSDDADVVNYKPDSVDDGVYGMALVSLFTDTRRYSIATSKAQKLRYTTRLLLAITFLFFTLGIQLYLIFMTKFIVTPKAVQTMREKYSEYEVFMYNGHTAPNPNGHQRGLDPMYFNISKFPEFKKAHGDDVCDMPLTQPYFTFCIVLLWSITCLRYIRSISTMTLRICVLAHVDSMEDALERAHKKGKKENVVGVTMCVKLFIVLFIQLPSLFVSVILLWIGSRWLIATLGFDELVLNAIALEFVLNLSGLLFLAIVPLSMKAEMENIKIPHTYTVERPGCVNMFGTFAVFIIGIVWSAFYVFEGQQVLVDYRWDVRAACATIVAHIAFF